MLKSLIVFRKNEELPLTEQIRKWKEETGHGVGDYYYIRRKYGKHGKPLTSIAKCFHCTYEWKTRIENPKVCANCNRPHWNRPLSITRQKLGVRWCDDAKEYMRRYNQKNPETEKQKKNRMINQRLFWERHKKDAFYRVAHSLRSSLLYATKSQGIRKCSSKKYGISYRAISEVVGPCPSKGYHLDHIRPLVTFDLTDPLQVKEALAPENLRWISSEENFKKNSRWAGEHWTREKLNGYANPLEYILCNRDD